MAKPSKSDLLDRTYELPSVSGLEHGQAVPLIVLVAHVERRHDAQEPHPGCDDSLPADIAADQTLDAVAQAAVHARREGADVVALFVDAEACLRVARTIVEQLPFDREVGCRIGIHRDEVRLEDGRVTGPGADLARAVAARSNPDWVLMTRAVYDLASTDQQLRSDSLDFVQFSREAPALELFRYQNGGDFVLTAMRREIWQPYRRTVLVPVAGGVSLTVEDDAVAIGRGEHNDLVLDDMYVSTDHARIERRRGEFVLIDTSLNGTFVSFEGESPFRVPQELRLRRGGSLWFGRRRSDPEAREFGFYFE